MKLTQLYKGALVVGGLLASTLTGVQAQSCTCDNAFLNGSFESPSIPSNYKQIHDSQVAGWNTTATDHKIEFWKSGFNGVPSAHGSQFVEINATQVASLYQELCLEPGTEIQWSIYHRGRSGTDVAKIRMGGTINSAVNQATMSDGNTSWGHYTGNYTVPSGQTSTFFVLESVSSAGSNSYGNFVDGFEITIISNPCDTDGDGVIDSEDDFPNDPDRAFNSTTSEGTLAFEDLWPNMGDFDFNDLVVDYQLNTVTNANNYVVDVNSVFTVRATGAGFHNGFGFQLPNNNVAANDITVTGSSINKNYISVNANGLESGQSLPTVIVFDDSYDVLQHPGSGLGINTIPGSPTVAPATITVTMSFKQNTYVTSDLDLANFNPFLIVNGDRGREIHLPDYAPTSLANSALFGTKDDSSIPGSRYYKTGSNLPWAINIPESFDYPIEKIEILDAYQYFDDWSQTGGQTYSDWYKNLSGYRNGANIY